jgi:hypothetical protein
MENKYIQVIHLISKVIKPKVIIKLIIIVSKPSKIQILILIQIVIPQEKK